MADAIFNQILHDSYYIMIYGKISMRERLRLSVSFTGSNICPRWF